MYRVGRFRLGWGRLVVLVVIVFVLAIVLSRLLESDEKGNSVTVLAAGEITHIDPAQSDSVGDLYFQYAVQRPLYSYATKTGKLQPDLATERPVLSPDGLVVTVEIREGVFFSPPLDREVLAKDVKYAIERAFTANVPSGFAHSSPFFTAVIGAPSKPGAYKLIAGIKTPDSHTIVFELSHRVRGDLREFLSNLITVPVPQQYAEKFDTESLSSYGRHVVFTGPYMIKNNTDGTLTGYSPGRSIELVRNPNWNEKTDHRSAFLDQITIIRFGNLYWPRFGNMNWLHLVIF